MNRAIVIALASLFVVGSLVVGVAAPASASTNVVEGFESDVASSWRTVSGSPSVSAFTPSTEGSTALRLGYDFAGGSIAEIGRVSTPPTVAGPIPSRMLVDVYGDGTYNTAYIRLRDATNETFMYRLANLNVAGWTTVTVDLSQPPAYVAGGNGNGVLDLPLSVYQFNVGRNGSQSATGFAAFDNVRFESWEWEAPSSSAQVFSALAGASTSISFVAGAPGDYSLTLRDLQGHTFTSSGTAAEAGSITFDWNGQADGGGRLEGNIGAVLSSDQTPDSSLDTTATRIGVPYLVGVSARAPQTSLGSITGVNSFLTTLDDPVEVDGQAKLMEDAYVGYAREEFDWNRIEPRAGYFDWAKFDQAVELALARGVRIVGKLVYTAAWASSAPSGTLAGDVGYYPPVSNDSFAEYARAVVERYKDRISVWEVWNEPNTSAHWKPTPNPIAYGNLLVAAYAAIKAEDPTSTVLGGSLAGFSDDFMNGVLAAGGGNSYDGLAIHTYVGGAPEASISSLWIDGANAFLQRHGAGDRKVWVTEMGWSTCGGGCANSVSEANQAAYLERAYLDASARGVRGMFWFSLIEFGNSASTLDNYGLVEQSGRTKPAYTALANVGHALWETGSAGFVSPTADGLFYIVHDLDTAAPFRVSTLGGGSASIASTTTGRHSGAGALRLTYAFTGASQGAELSLNRQVSGSPKAISVWVYGDGSATPIFMKFVDATGESFQAKIGHAVGRSWQRLTFYLDGGNPSYSHWGGNNDGVVNYPITVSSLYFYRPVSGVQFGQIYVDDLTAHYGTITRGAVLLGRQQNIQMVYALSNSSAQLPVAGTVATLQQGSGQSSLSISGGTVSVPVGPGSATIVSSTPGSSPTPAHVGELVGIVWRGGDRSAYTIQVFKESGAVIRFIASTLAFDSGRRTATWNGRTAQGAIAPAGNYFFRLILHGNDGRLSVVDTPFTLVDP